MKKDLKAFIELLTKDNKGTFSEGFSDNDGKRQGASFEGYLNQELVEIGFPDFTSECENLHPKHSRNEFELFGNFETKRARIEYLKWFKSNLEENTKEVIATLKSGKGFIEQPLSSKRQPDIFVWWTNEDGSKGWLLIDVKTGGGKGPKLNDREIGWDHLVIFNSRNKDFINKPTTVAFARDIFKKEEYEEIEAIRKEMNEVRKRNNERQSSHTGIRYNHRDRVEILAPTGNWFKPINGITREEREQRVIDFLS